MSSNLCQQSQAHRLYSLYLHYDASHAAKHEDPECKAVLQHCFALFEKDYVVGTVPNHNGQLCPSYPSELAILEKPRHLAQRVDGPGKADMQESNKGQSRSIQGDVASIPTEPSHPTPAASLLTSTSSRIHPFNSSVSPRFATQNRGTTADKNEGDNNHNSQHEPVHSESMDNSMIEEGDQSFDLGESGMMSFQDIKTELDFIHHPSPLKNPAKDSDRSSRRHILPFPFRIPRTEESKNYAVKEYVEPSSTAAAPSNSIDNNDSNSNNSGNADTKPDKDKVNDTQELSKQFEKSHFARVRARFVIPCILVRGKNICRSATLSNEVEVFMHSFNQKFNELNQKRKMFLYGTGEKSPDKGDRESSLERQRLEDIELLHRLGVTYINDLMVENRKVKYGLKVTSSEKVDSFGRYSKFKLVATPYPGVEFFQKFKANKYSARKLCFDWSQNFADAELQLPPGHMDNLGIRWRDYKGWDLIELTQNYLRLYLSHIADDSTSDQRLPHEAQDQARSQRGLLIHCISGWDRTPLFISLLRISLWADGEAHQSLSAAEILYLTMGYDWFLFNHLLADRSQRGEDIFYFCFYFLKFIYGDEFSLKSVSDLKDSGNGRAQTNKSNRAPTVSPSPFSRDLGRVRDSDFGSASPPMDGESHGNICDECRTTRRMSMEPLGRDMVPRRGSAQDVASSTDGKPSSWQLVTLSTPPRGDRHGSPRAPFVPTLPTIGKASGSPLGGNRKVFPAIGFADDKRFSNTDSAAKNFNTSTTTTTTTTSTSPFLVSEGRSHLGSFNARRSSSSSIPELFLEESKRQVAAAAAGGVPVNSSVFQNTASNVELSRLATSPNLFAASRPQDAVEGETSVGSQGDESLLERQRTPRKRASTFDGGLLLSNEPGARASSDEENCDDIEEDLTSGDEDTAEDNLEGHPEVAQTATHASDESKLSPASAAATQSQICQVCHHSFVPKAASGGLEAEDRSSHSDLMGNSPNSVLHGHSKHMRPQCAKMGPIESMRDEGLVYGGQDMDYLCHPGFQQSQPDECDRDEGMFQLEIEDSGKGSLGMADDCRCDNQPNTRHSAYLGRGSCSGSPKCSASKSDSIASSSPSTERNLNLAGNRSPTPVHPDDECLDGDENESLWDETSTVDYGYSPGSILNGFGLGLTKYPTETEDDLGLGLDDSLRADGVGEDRDDQEDDDDDEEDDVDDDDDDDETDVSDRLRKRRGGAKASHSDHDQLFMPSLQGVFSNTGRHADRARGSSSTGTKSAKDTRNTTATLGPSTGSEHTGQFSRLQEGTSPASFDSLPPRPPSPPKPLTRRQKLRQLRRLFMDIRDEIGDGSRPPSVILDTKSSTRGAAAVGGLSIGSVGPLDDGGRSLKAESFSDDPSFQYRSPIATAAAFANRLHHGSGSSAGYPEPESSNQPFFSRSRVGSGGGIGSGGIGSGGILSPVAKHTTKQQLQPSLQGNNPMNPPASGRKSPFEWAAAAASSAAASITSSASGIVTGGFGGNGNNGNGGYNGSNHGNSNNDFTVASASNFGGSRFEHRSGPSGSSHYSRQFTMPSPHIPSPQGQQPSHHNHQSRYSGSTSHFKTSTTGTTTPPMDPFAYESTTSVTSSGTKQSPNLVFSSRFDAGQGTTRRQSMTAAGAAAMNISHSKTTGAGETYSSGGAGSPVLSMSSPSRLRSSGHGFGGSHHSSASSSTTGMTVPVSTASGGGVGSATPASMHIREKGGEHNGRWDWMPGIFA
ncbi:myotubularin-related protein 14 [Entomortierella parvispora]|uniref:Myotubularin-related protein 14 n=1 Tax=Entomortierella parvispora TaxID=205924 RepID=A0A9P3LUK7_9FUNG|nr:myotubularin-related protein 14 [Entomortierella parvispora]